MPSLDAEDVTRIDRALQSWRQGDVALDDSVFFLHLADLGTPLTTEARETANAHTDSGEGGSVEGVASVVPGVVLVTQTCDIVRSCAERPYVEVSPLIEVPRAFLDDVRRLRRPAFAHVPAVETRGLVADLDRTMTVEKAVVATWERTPGWTTDAESRAFADALSRKRARFAFPDDFVAATRQLQTHLKRQHNRQNSEGAHLRSLREIRVRAAPSWDHATVDVFLWFVKESDPLGCQPAWHDHIDKWKDRFDAKGRFTVDGAVVCGLEDMTAQDYVESDRLDLDQLSSHE